MIFMGIFALVCLCFCWYAGEQTLQTKMVFTFLFLASFGLLFVSRYEYLFTIAQCVLVAVIGGSTFGIDWLMKRH